MAISSNQHKKQHKKNILIAIVAIIILCGVGFWFFINQQGTREANNSSQRSNNSSSSVNPKDTSSKDAEEKKDFLDEDKNTDTDDTDSNSTPQPTPITIDMSAKASGDTVVVTTKLFYPASGVCTLTISGEGTSITKTAEVMYAPEYSSCAGFTVPKNEIKSTNLTFTLNVKTGSTNTTKTINFTL